MVNLLSGLFLYTLALHCFVASFAANTKNITTDKSSLLAFQLQITSEPNNLLANNWSTTSSVCSWVGVTCDDRHGRVHSLNLTNMGLRGTVSPNLGNLSFLVTLDLSHNTFVGQFPKEICRLRRLKFLEISNNEFNGGVPTKLGDLSQLQHLYIAANNFSGLIPQSIGNLRGLTILDASSNGFSGHIPQTISNMSSLEYLRLDINYFSGTPSFFV